MIGNMQKFLVGASVIASFSAICSPAFAGTLTGASIGGTAASDYYVYDSDSTNTFKVASTQANVIKVLDGDSSKPTGNVELAASSETSTFDFTKYTSLIGTIGGKSITLSSLTAADWFTTTGNTFSTAYGVSNLANTWFASLMNAAKLPVTQLAYTLFLNNKGFERASDPNISYVNQDDSTGKIKIGLAGHYDISDVYSFLPKGTQASELVKVSYDGGPAQILKSFSATRSGLVEKGDSKSHTGNYEVTIAGVPPAAKTPEPSAMLAMLGVGALFATKRKLMKKM